METELEELYAAYKPLLQSIAYRMLGSITDAEDMVQDVFAAMQRSPAGDVRHMKAYLVKMVTNRCLNVLKSAARQREVYVGPWLPEPDIGDVFAVPTMMTPEERAVREEIVSYAVLVMLQQLSPVERAVFVLREVLAYDYKEIAGILGKTEAGCRKIYSRLQPKLAPEPGSDRLKAVSSVTPADASLLVAAFLQASRTGDFQPFIHLLVDDAVLVSDGGGKVRAAIRPILGRDRVLAFLEGISGKGSFQGELRPARINGEAGLLLVRDGILQAAVCFGWADGGTSRWKTIYLISNPDKLQRLRS